MTAKELNRVLKLRITSTREQNDKIFPLLEEFINQLCKEQREICVKSYKESWVERHNYYEIINNLKSSPNPET